MTGRLSWLAVGGLLALGLTGTAGAKTLFRDDFSAAKLGAQWQTEHTQTNVGPPKWVLEGGVLKQTNPQPGDAAYAIVNGTAFPAQIGILAKIRLDDWKDHDRSRAGVGVYIDPADKFNGYTWLIHERLAATNMEFLNDQRAWFNGEATFAVTVGRWYWMKMFIDDKMVSGKIWADGTAEPSDWLSTMEYGKFGALRKASNLVGLNGGAGTAGGGHSTASFDDVTVFDAGGPDPATAVDPLGKTATTWAVIKSR